MSKPGNQAEPKYRGLTNQGSTCYLNSVLQVLFMTKEFRDALQRKSSTPCIDAQLKKFFNKLETSSPPTKDIILRLGIENVWEQQDAAEYFEKILRLASPEASEVFLVRSTRCTSFRCDNSSAEPSLLWTIYLLNNDTSMDYNVQKGLEGYFSESKSTGDNQMYCFNCKVRSDTITKWTIHTYPKVLVLLLKRYAFSLDKMDYVKNDCPVVVPLNVELPKLPKVQGAQGVSYELYATVDHVGNLGAGHYTATIQSPDDRGCWYNFNDSRVTPNSNPIKSQNGYLLFYRKTQMSDSPQVHPHGSSVDPAESEPNQNNADNGYADHASFQAPPSPSARLDGKPGWAGRGDVTEGVVLTECGDVTRADDVTVGVDVTKYGEVTEVGSREPADHPVPQEASDLEGGDVTEGGEVTGGVEVVGGDPQPTESERVDSERMTTDVEVPTNEKESRGPGDHSVPQEASGNAPTFSSPEVVVNEGWGGRRESTDHLEDPGEGETEGGVIQKTDDGNADHDSDGDDHHTTPSSSGPMVKQPASAGSSDVTGGEDVMECGDVGAGDVVGAGDPLRRESERLDRKGGERMTTGVEVPTNEKESREPGDQAVQQEASGTGPMVSGPEGGVNERRRGLRESMDLLEVREEGETEGRVIQKKRRKVFDIPNCFSGLCLSSRPRLAKRKLGNEVDMVEDKKSIKKRRKNNSFMCYNKQTSDTE